MFRDARTLDRNRTASSFQLAYSRYAEAAENWFDGSVGSVDRRLAQCDRLLHSARFTVARVSITESSRYLRAAEELDADRRALTALRDDLLNGASNREEVSGLPGWRTASPDPANVHADGPTDTAAPGGAAPVSPVPGASPFGGQTGVAPSVLPNMTATFLAGPDGRWVALEAAKFVAANADALDSPHELATRAQDHAAMKTSTFTPQRSAVICRAFVASVVDLGVRSYRPVVVRVAAAEPDWDPQAMFL